MEETTTDSYTTTTEENTPTEEWTTTTLEPMTAPTETESDNLETTTVTYLYLIEIIKTSNPSGCEIRSLCRCE